jgi:hemerythrin superfamily protein
MDAITLLKDDHKTVKGLFTKYEALGDRAIKSKQNIADRVIKELSIHAAIEEQVVYPAIRRSVTGGAQLVDHALQEHQEAKEALARLERLSPSDDDFDEVMTDLIEDVRSHMREEEGTIFPRLRDSMGRNELQQMADALKMAKRGAPTHPHPRAPSTPPGNIIAGAAAGVLDRLRDLGREAINRGR